PRIVDLGAGKPDRAGHLALGDDGLERRWRLQIVIVPDAVPEAVEIAHRPLPHVLVASEGEAALLGEPIAVEGDLGNESCGHCLSTSVAGKGSLSAAAAYQKPQFAIASAAK